MVLVTTIEQDQAPSELEQVLGITSSMLQLIQAYGVGAGWYFLTWALTLAVVGKLPNASDTRRRQAHEILLIRFQMRVLRVVLLYLMLWQLPLFQHALDHPNRATFFESILRPLGNVLLGFFGLVTNTHCIFRWLYMIGVVFMIGTDTVSYVVLDEDIKCLGRGLSCSGFSNDVQELRYFQSRDWFALAGFIASSLHVGFLAVAIGCCSSRYSPRVLSTGRKYVDIREILKADYPDL